MRRSRANRGSSVRTAGVDHHARRASGGGTGTSRAPPRTSQSPRRSGKLAEGLARLAPRPALVTDDTNGRHRASRMSASPDSTPTSESNGACQIRMINVADVPTSRTSAIQAQLFNNRSAETADPAWSRLAGRHFGTRRRTAFVVEIVETGGPRQMTGRWADHASDGGQRGLGVHHRR